MNIEDIDVRSLLDQKVPYPFIESVVLNDKDGISLDMRYAFYAPITTGDKDIFDSYKNLIWTDMTLFTFDISEPIPPPMLPNVDFISYLENSPNVNKQNRLEDKGPFYKSSKAVYDILNSVLGISHTNPSIDTGPPGKSLVHADTSIFYLKGIQVRKYSYEAQFTNLKATEPFGKVIAGDRVINLMGFIEVMADFKDNLPFAISGGNTINYSFPFVIAKNGVVNFTYQALQTSNNEIWVGPFSVEKQETPPKGNTTLERGHTHYYTVDDDGDGETEKHYATPDSWHVHKITNRIVADSDVFVKGGPSIGKKNHSHQLIADQIKKLPVDSEDHYPYLLPVVISDPAVVSSFVGLTTGDYFDLDFNQPLLTKWDKKNKKWVTTTENPATGEAYTAKDISKTTTLNLEAYFEPNKLEKIESPLSEMFFWDDIEPNTFNTAFIFNTTKFMNSSAFAFTGTKLNIYSDNIKSMQLVRRKVAKNIAEQYTEQCMEKVLATCVPIGTKGVLINIIDNANIRVASVDCTTNAGVMQTLFMIKDKTVNKNYHYRYGLKITYTAKFLGQLRYVFELVNEAYNKFSALESVMAFSKYYNADFERMTPLFVQHHGEVLQEMWNTFNSMWSIISSMITDSEQNQESGALIVTIKDMLAVDWEKQTTRLLPSTYLVLKDSIGQSLSQVKNFSVAPNLTVKPTQGNSSNSTVATKYYEFANAVGFTEKPSFWVDYLYATPPQSENTELVITQKEFENLFQLEFAKYVGGIDEFVWQHFDTHTFTPLTITAEKVTAQMLDIGSANMKTAEGYALTFSLPLTQIIDLVLSMKAGITQTYPAKTPTSWATGFPFWQKNGVLLDALLDDGVAIVGTTDKGTVVNPVTPGKFAFESFFGGSSGPQDKKKSTSPTITKQFQNIKDLTMIYSFSHLAGFNTYTNTMDEIESIESQGGEALNTNLPVPYYVLSRGPSIKLLKPLTNEFKTLFDKILINKETLKTKEDKKKWNLRPEEAIGTFLMLTNVVEIELWHEGEWHPYNKVKNGLGSVATLGRFSFYERGLKNPNGSFVQVRNVGMNQRINNRYFVFDTESKEFNTIKYTIPAKSKNDPPVKIEVVLKKEKFSGDTALKQAANTMLKGSLFKKPAYKGGSAMDKPNAVQVLDGVKKKSSTAVKKSKTGAPFMGVKKPVMGVKKPVMGVKKPVKEIKKTGMALKKSSTNVSVKGKVDQIGLQVSDGSKKPAGSKKSKMKKTGKKTKMIKINIMKLKLF